MKQIIAGYDPGGNGSHGLAMIEINDESVSIVDVLTLDSAEEVIRVLEGANNLVALGVDSLVALSTGPSGWRPADRWLRKRYPEVEKSIISPNGLYGAMALNGLAVIGVVKRNFPDICITETHPKVLYWVITKRKYEYRHNSDCMDEFLMNFIGVSLETQNEHEWDALVSAYSALMGFWGQWKNDLFSLECEQRERIIYICGEVYYYWPE